MSISSIAKKILPEIIIRNLRIVRAKFNRARIESNKWLRVNCKDINGKILSIGSSDDSDGQGDFYRNYFPTADSYTTSDIYECKCDLILDVRSMPEIDTESYDGIYCSGVLEHVDDYQSAILEITRILKTDGTLLLGLPFRQETHMAPQDFWRFTEYGIRYLLKDSYEILELASIDPKRGMDFPATYWVKAVKKSK